MLSVALFAAALTVASRDTGIADLSRRSALLLATSKGVRLRSLPALQDARLTVEQVITELEAPPHAAQILRASIDSKIKLQHFRDILVSFLRRSVLCSRATAKESVRISLFSKFRGKFLEKMRGLKKDLQMCVASFALRVLPENSRSFRKLTSDYFDAIDSLYDMLERIDIRCWHNRAPFLKEEVARVSAAGKALETRVVVLADVGLKLWAVSVAERPAVRKVVPLLKLVTLEILEVVASVKNHAHFRTPALIALDMVVSCLEALVITATASHHKVVMDEYLLAIRKTLQLRVNPALEPSKSGITLVVLRDQLKTTDLVLRLSGPV